jgi:S-formylglutathione hydrolase FrmB
MAVAEIHLNANDALGKMTSVSVILPEGLKGPFPVYYLLHGLSDDHTVWLRRTSIERYFDQTPIIVVMPNCDRSFYNDSPTVPEYAYETYLTKYLVDLVDSTFQTIAAPEGRAIGGLSMGGYGALKTALKHPEIYSAAVAHSGVHGIAQMSLEPHLNSNEEYALHFGVAPIGGDDDVFALLEKTTAESAPKIWIDCGSEDFLIEHNRKLRDILAKKGIDHEYSERPGAHTWDFWDDSLKLVLPWLKTQLNVNANV